MTVKEDTGSIVEESSDKSINALEDILDGNGIVNEISRATEIRRRMEKDFGNKNTGKRRPKIIL